MKEYLLSFLPWKRIASFRVNFNTEVSFPNSFNLKHLLEQNNFSDFLKVININVY